MMNTFYVLITERQHLTSLGPFHSKEERDAAAKKADNRQLDSWSSLYAQVFIAELTEEGKLLIERYVP
jgi:hypothetical protein